jgi:predicted PurR-regulated permease PerM
VERSIYRALLLFGATLLVLYAFGLILRPFIVPIMWALCLSAVTSFAYRTLARKTGRPRLSAIVMVVTTALTILVPLIFVGVLVVTQARTMDLGPTIARMQTELPGVVAWIDGLLSWLGGGTLEELYQNLHSRVPEFATAVLGDSPVKAGLSIVATPFIFLFGLAVTLITQYFLYREAPRLRQAVIDLSPLTLDDTDRILTTLRETTSASVLGGLLVAVIQGGLGGIGFMIAGIDSPLVWGVLMTACSLLPFGGTAIVWLPAALYLLATGEAGGGWFLLIWGVVIVGSSDNFLRPWILYRTGSRDIHPLLLFFAILSGIGLFGVSGIVFGPLLLALLTTVMQIYREHWPRDPITGELEGAPTPDAD